MGGEVGGEFAGAVAPGHKIQEFMRLGMQRRFQGGTPGAGYGRRRQTRTRIGIPGGIGGQVFLAYSSLIRLAHTVNDGGIGLQSHADAQTIDENAGNFVSIGAVARSEERRVGKECVSTSRSRWS